MSILVSKSLVKLIGLQTVILCEQAERRFGSRLAEEFIDILVNSRFFEAFAFYLKMPDGNEGIYKWTSAGKLETNFPSLGWTEKGKSWIVGDSLCIQYEDEYRGLTNCWDCYYIPEGDGVVKNEYLLVNDASINTITIKEN